MGDGQNGQYNATTADGQPTTVTWPVTDENVYYGCVHQNDGNWECNPECCGDDPPPPNVNVATQLAKKGVGPDEFYEAESCCFGPWDIYVKQVDGRGWMLDSTVYCLTDVADTYANLGKEYTVVLSGEPYDWDPLADKRTPECFWEVDPYKA